MAQMGGRTGKDQRTCGDGSCHQSVHYYSAPEHSHFGQLRTNVYIKLCIPLGSGQCDDRLFSLQTVAAIVADPKNLIALAARDLKPTKSTVKKSETIDVTHQRNQSTRYFPDRQVLYPLHRASTEDLSHVIQSEDFLLTAANRSFTD
jgi:hypothetical protein